MKKSPLIQLLIVHIMIFSSGCPAMPADIIQNPGIDYLVIGDKTFTKFGLLTPAIEGVIDETAKTILIIVPTGTNLRTLTARFYTTGISVKANSRYQVSGFTVNDFTLPVEYTVTAEDGSTAVYTVTVRIDNPADKKAILSFTFMNPEPLDTTIDETTKNISVLFPFGTDPEIFSTLTADFTTDGASVKVGTVEQSSNVTVNDFSSSVVYTVTAENGTQVQYTITLSVKPGSPNKALSSFSLANPKCVGIINETNKTISLAVPYGSPINLCVSFSTNGVNVKVETLDQTSGVTFNDFSNPVTYRVIAQDGSTADYLVTVTADPSNIERIASGFSPSMTLDLQDHLHVSFRDISTGQQRYANNSTGTWTLQDIENVGTASSKNSLLVTDNTNNAYMIYNYKTGLNYATNASGAWIVTAFEAPTSGVFTPKGFLMDTIGNVHVIENFTAASGNGLKYATNSSGIWSYSTIFNNAVPYSAMAIDGADTIHLCYYDSTGKTLNYIYKTAASSAWSTPEIIASGFSAGNGFSVTTDLANHVHVACYDATNKDLSYATNSSGVWILTPVDTVGDVGLYSDIITATDGSIHISYYDVTNMALKYARKTGLSWECRIVDANGAVGLYTNIARISSMGQIHIVYLDSTNLAVKHAIIE